MPEKEFLTGNLDNFLLEEVLWISESKINSPNYDFDFDKFFVCRRPLYRNEKIVSVGRFGVIFPYNKIHDELISDGIQLIHTPEENLKASDLTHWYPLIKGFTPRSIWFDKPPSFSEIENNFELPVFVKGSRQTNRHNKKLSIVKTKKDFEQVSLSFTQDPILHWQKFVVRVFVDLRKVKGKRTEKITPSFEFRTFWWKGNLVGSGKYWRGLANYNWTREEKVAGISLAEKAVKKLNLPFITVDIAQKPNGEWIIIEINDGQESGYTSVSPIGLWQNIINLEKKKRKNL